MLLLWKSVPQRSIDKQKEMWQYSNRNRTSELDPFYLTYSSKTPTTRFYYIRTKCIHYRFPYCTSASLQVDSEVFLTNSRKKVIREQLNILLLRFSPSQVDNRNKNNYRGNLCFIPHLCKI